MKYGIERTAFRLFVGKRIRTFRNKAGLTQMQLAFMSDLDRSFIQKVVKIRKVLVHCVNYKYC